MPNMDEAQGGTRGWVQFADKQRFLLVVLNGTNSNIGDTCGDRQTWNDWRSNRADS